MGNKEGKKKRKKGKMKREEKILNCKIHLITETRFSTYFSHHQRKFFFLGQTAFSSDLFLWKESSEINANVCSILKFSFCKKKKEVHQLETIGKQSAHFIIVKVCDCMGF